ncbi:MAG: SPW repeat protein [Burkholderiaceae bacterium]|nr:SPW repeat protein [Burkholderiaceae bacterium]MCX8003617.1 SPW repeat protein [Burkholderiaceae bacterium]
MTIKHWQDPVNLVLGVWMIVSPWLLSYAGEAVPTWNAAVLGILIGAAAIWAMFRVFAWQQWANVVFGLWLIASPWILGFAGVTAALYNAVIVGLIVAVLALWALGTDRDIGGWWKPAH